MSVLALMINLSVIFIISTFSTQPTVPETRLHLLRPHKPITYHFCPDYKNIIITIASVPRIFGFLHSSIFNNFTFDIKPALSSKPLDPIEMPTIFYFLDLIKFQQPSSLYNNSLHYCIIYTMIINSHEIFTSQYLTCLLTLHCWKHSVQTQCLSCKHSSNYHINFTIINILRRIIISILGTTHNCQDAS